MDSGDSVAKKLLAEFRTQMPSFKMLSDAELNSLLAYMHTYKRQNCTWQMTRTQDTW
jgi:hypothetical protein